MPSPGPTKTGFFDSTQRLLVHACFAFMFAFGLYWLIRSVVLGPDALGVDESGIRKAIDLLVFYAFGPFFMFSAILSIRSLRRISRVDPSK